MALINHSDLQGRMQRNLTDAEITAFDTINTALQTWIEEQIGSSVEEVTESTRYYDGGSQHLDIDPCTDVTALKWVDEFENPIETITTENYVLQPRNRTLKTHISYRWGKMPRGIANVAVTAKYSVYGDAGWRAIIKDAMLDMLAQDIQDTTGSQKIKKESIEGYSVEFESYEQTANIKALQSLIDLI